MQLKVAKCLQEKTGRAKHVSLLVCLQDSYAQPCACQETQGRAMTQPSLVPSVQAGQEVSYLRAQAQHAQKSTLLLGVPSGVANQGRDEILYWSYAT